MKTNIKSKVIRIKYLDESSDAGTFLEIVKEKLFNLHPEIKKNFAQKVALLCNIQIESNLDPLKPVKHIITGWLSLGNSLKRLLQNWESIRLYMKKLYETTRPKNSNRASSEANKNIRSSTKVSMILK